MSRDGYNTDARLMEAIEAVTGGNLDCRGECGNSGCDGTQPQLCGDPAVKLWCDGGHEQELRDWLNNNYPDWKNDSPLIWGEDKLS